MRCLLIFFAALYLAGCGVKAPPIAPEKKIENLQRLDCSPQDPECDATDPKYKPRGR